MLNPGMISYSLLKNGDLTLNLRAELGTDHRRTNWLQHLWSHYPENDNCLYCHDVKIPAVDERERSTSPCEILHIAYLAIDDRCSPKTFTDRPTAMGLLEEILKDGVVTSGDPWLVSQPAIVSGSGSKVRQSQFH